jgi:drug/metabolite transporter (DMT)-like permease
MLIRLSPALFVFLWSTGWIAGRAVAPYAEPLSFLTARFALAALALGLVVAWTGASWPKTRAEVARTVVVGVLMHGMYLASVWYVIRHGLPASISGVIAAIQPVLTAALAPWLLGERLSAAQRAGIGLGFGGIALVLQPNLARVAIEELGPLAWLIAINVGGMVAVTLATFYQKRHLTAVDMRTSTLIQYVAAVGFVAPLALALETGRIEWNPTVILTMAWSVLALSLGAIMLLLLLIQRGAVSRAATYIYLVPPAVAIEAWLLFGETLSALQLVGMALTVAGVALAVRKA